VARLPSIARSIQEMCKDQVIILRQKQLTAGVDGLSDKEVAQLEMLARINAINIKADPQVKPKGSAADDTSPEAIAEAARQLEARPPPSVGAATGDDE
jgi:hypothetical protein